MPHRQPATLSLHHDTKKRLAAAVEAAAMYRAKARVTCYEGQRKLVSCNRMISARTLLSTHSLLAQSILPGRPCAVHPISLS